MAKRRNFRAKIEKQNKAQRYSGGNLPVAFVVDAGDFIRDASGWWRILSGSQQLSRTDVGNFQLSRYEAGKLSVPAGVVAIVLKSASHVRNA